MMRRTPTARPSGVQQAHKEDKITFPSLTPWPGELVCAEGRYVEGDAESGREKRAAIFLGPEFGTVSRPDLVAAAERYLVLNGQRLSPAAIDDLA
jgi:adenine-specific DNA-methyltransferase